jgi:hypothetical protein
MNSDRNIGSTSANESRQLAVDSQIQRILLAGIQTGWEGQQRAIHQVHELRPDLSEELIDEYMQTLANDRLPGWLKPEFWTPTLDQILLAGLRDGTPGQRKAVNKVLKLHPELRPEAAWSRLRHLQRLKHRGGRRGVRFPWTAELDGALMERCHSDGVDAAVSDLADVTSYPRDAIRRRVRRLGFPGDGRPASRPWTPAELKFLVESVQHLPVRTIAKELHRSEKAIWRKAAESGVSAKCLEGYTVTEILKNLHVSHGRLRLWIGAGWIKVGRNRRITERSLRSFLREHRAEIPWDRLDTTARDWLLEFGVDAREPVRLNAAGGAG